MSEETKSRVPVIAGAVAAVVLVAIIIGVVASSSSPKKSASSTTTVSTTTIPNDFKNNARQDVSVGSCVHQNGEWVLSGGIVNSAKVARKYQIIVDYVTPTGGTVVDSATLEVAKVKPAQRYSWRLGGAKGVAHANCVIRNVRAVPIA